MNGRRRFLLNTTSPAIHDLARRLLAGMPASAEATSGDADEVVRACDKLRIPLTRLAGATGFSSLLSRALTVARRQVPELAELRVTADGSLEGFQEISRDRNAVEATRHGGAVLLAELLGLLVTLIGKPLTLSLVREAWPDMALETMAPDTAGNNAEVRP
jgi:hypothetical protein